MNNARRRRTWHLQRRKEMTDATPRMTAAEFRAQSSSEYSEQNHAHALAIDPGQNTGLAFAKDGEIRETACLGFWEAVNWILDWGKPEDTLILLEDPNMNPFTFRQHSTNPKKRERISRNVGKNQRDAQLLKERLEAECFDVKSIKPVPSSKKWDRDWCRRVTGYDGTPNNEHVRDAVKMLFTEGWIR